MATRKRRPNPLTKSGVVVTVETRPATFEIAIHTGIVQTLFSADQARLLAKQLRQAAAVIDPDPNTEA